MGFPAPVFSEPELPRLLLSLLFLLSRLRRLSSWLLHLTGARVDANLSFDRPTASRSAGRHRRLSSWLLHLTGARVDANLSFDRPTASRSAGRHRRQELYRQDHRLEELEEHSPAMRFDALSTSGDGAEALVLPESCAVCLGDFDAAARVRRPRGCRHVFHRACLDRWAAQGHSTCPLCRAPFLPPFLLPLPLPPAS